MEKGESVHAARIQNANTYSARRTRKISVREIRRLISYLRAIARASIGFPPLRGAILDSANSRYDDPARIVMKILASEKKRDDSRRRKKFYGLLTSRRVLRRREARRKEDRSERDGFTSCDVSHCSREMTRSIENSSAPNVRSAVRHPLRRASVVSDNMESTYDGSAPNEPQIRSTPKESLYI